MNENAEPGANFYSESARERDLDHFLIEELQASPDFRAWFLGHLGHCFNPPQDVRVRTERSPARLTDGRQTDLRIAFYDTSGTLLALVLVENKVADGFRPGQPEGYAREVAAWREQLGEKRAASVLVAPRSNYHLSARHHFDAFVAVDDMTVFLKERLGRLEVGELRERLEIRIDLLEALTGKRPNSQWIPQPLAEKVNVAEEYDQLVKCHLPGYRVSATVAGRRSGDRFFSSFPGRDLFRGNVQLKHRLYDGVVCLEFRGSAFTPATLDALPLPQDGSVRRQWTGRKNETLQLQVRAPALGAHADATSRESDITACLNAVKYLAGWFASNIETLNQAAAKRG